MCFLAYTDVGLIWMLQFQQPFCLQMSFFCCSQSSFVSWLYLPALQMPNCKRQIIIQEEPRKSIFHEWLSRVTRLSRVTFTSDVHSWKMYHFPLNFRTMQKNRSVILTITTLFSLGYIFGTTSAHFQQNGLIITFLVVQLALAMAIHWRTIGDEQVSLSEIFVPQFFRPGLSDFFPIFSLWMFS